MSNAFGVRFARIVYILAGIIGLLELLPLYFLESMIGRTNPPPITHPDFYYGFIGVAVAVAWQVAFLVMSLDPLRYRPLMPVTWIEKLLYPVAAWILYFSGRVSIDTARVATFDLVWLSLFVVAWVKTRES